MAIIQGPTRLYKRARITMRDIQGQTLPIAFYLVNAGAEADAALIAAFSTLLSNMEVLSSAVVTNATIESVSEIDFTSNSSASVSQYATVDQVMALNFQRVNPLKPTGVINKTFPIPAYAVGVASKNFPNAGRPNVGQVTLDAVTAFLNARLAFRYAGDGLIYSGLTFVEGDSAGVSLPDVVDNN